MMYCVMQTNIFLKIQRIINKGYFSTTTIHFVSFDAFYPMKFVLRNCEGLKLQFLKENTFIFEEQNCHVFVKYYSNFCTLLKMIIHHQRDFLKTFEQFCLKLEKP